MRLHNHAGQGVFQRATVPSLATIKSLFSLTKPGIVGLTLVAALTGIYFGNHGLLPEWSLLGWMFVTLGLATAGACILNNVYDQDIDALMNRTRSRALVAGSVSPAFASGIGLGLAVFPVVVMAERVNVVAALLTGTAVFGYVVIYTIMAKRRTPWANQLGGIAGALPPVIGYAAVAGAVDAEALILFAIMAVWQQPHALSLALKYRDDYAHAGVPVIPVVKGVQSTKWRIAIYTAVLLPVALLPYVHGMAGRSYLLVALAVSLMFLYKAVKFLFSSRDCDMKLFAFSIIYLIALFGAMIWDINQGIAS